MRKVLNVGGNAKVLAGFRHVLKDEGFAHIRVPDLGEVMRQAVQKSLDTEAATAS